MKLTCSTCSQLIGLTVYFLVWLSSIVFTSQSHAGMILLNFDDLSAKIGNNTSDVIREEYQSLGVHFNSDGRHSGIVRAGVFNGDPGNWNLDGTNGPYFLGHNSFGLTGIINFDNAIEAFSVDAARGSGALDSLTFRAYGANGLLESKTASSPIGKWITISLASSEIKRIEYFANSNFGLDNIRFSAVTVPEPSMFAGLLCLSTGYLTLLLRRSVKFFHLRCAK